MKGQASGDHVGESFAVFPTEIDVALNPNPPSASMSRSGFWQINYKYQYNQNSLYVNWFEV